jgi:peptide/nickel transport system substrate-binding protein
VGQIQDHIIDQALVIPLFEEPQVYGAHPRVRDVAFEAVGRPSFYGYWLEGGGT